jgi:hypothetical protein
MGYISIGNFMMLSFLTLRDPVIEPAIFAFLALVGGMGLLLLDSKGGVMSDELAETWDRNPRNIELLENQRKILAELKRMGDDI